MLHRATGSVNVANEQPRAITRVLTTVRTLSIMKLSRLERPVRSVGTGKVSRGRTAAIELYEVLVTCGVVEPMSLYAQRPLVVVFQAE
jgi:hypothetical protein